MRESRDTGFRHMDADLHRMQQQLADQLIARDAIRSATVEAAFRGVPRHLFVPDATPDRAYTDAVIATKFDPDTDRPISSSSQPAMMAIMLEQLDLQPGQRVLEIGAGTGFNAALMAHIVGAGEQAGGQVTTVDIDADLVAGARGHLTAAGYGHVRVVQADGMRGYAPDAPYDRIVLTVAAGDITPDWRDQLAPDGRVLLPLIVRDAQTSALFARDGDGFRSVSASPCMFMPLRGDFVTDDVYRACPLPGDRLALVDQRVDIRADTLSRLLDGPYRDRAARVMVSGWRLRDFGWWLGLFLPGGCTVLWAATAGDSAPRMLQSGDGRPGAWGLVDPQGKGLVLAMHPPEDATAPLDPGATFPLWLRCYGENGLPLAKRLVGALRRWQRAGMPGLSDATLHLIPHDRAQTTPRGAVVLPLRWHTLVIDWHRRNAAPV